MFSWIFFMRAHPGSLLGRSMPFQARPSFPNIAYFERNPSCPDIDDLGGLLFEDAG